jgi:hypothetical protein
MLIATWPWDWSSGSWAGLTFLVVFAGGIVAAWQVHEARRLREDQARPFVIIDFHPWQTIIELSIKNIGKTLARDVTFAFDPPLTSTRDDSSGRGKLTKLNLFQHGIPTLAPGREMKLFFDQFPSRLQAGLPLTYNVSVSYTDTVGRRYNDPTVLDLAAYLGTGGIRRDGLHEIHRRLEELVKEVKRWTFSGGGIKTMSPADIEKYHRDLDALYAETDPKEESAAPSEP